MLQYVFGTLIVQYSQKETPKLNLVITNFQILLHSVYMYIWPEFHPKFVKTKFSSGVSFWLYCKQYSDLYLAVRKKYANAVIIFCGILPRWDCEELYQQAIYYNVNLQTLCTGYAKFKYIETCHPNHKFVISDECFKWDGLHLNNVGRFIFGEELSTTSTDVCHCLQKTCACSCHLNSRSYGARKEKRRREEKADENAEPHQNQQSCQPRSLPSTTQKAKKSTTCHNVPTTEPTPCHTPSTTQHSCQDKRIQQTLNLVDEAVQMTRCESPKVMGLVYLVSAYIGEEVQQHIYQQVVIKICLI